VCSKQRRSGDMLDDSAAESSDSLFEHRHQRACVAADERPVLARDEILDTVFSFVGIDDYYYVAGVCRNWRGRYMSFCHRTPDEWTGVVRRPYTSCSSIVATADRLQLALDSGLTIELLDTSSWDVAFAFITDSLESRVVLALGRLYGLKWNNLLTQCAAQCKK
jgi:hypothetical protein